MRPHPIPDTEMWHKNVEKYVMLTLLTCNSPRSGRWLQAQRVVGQELRIKTTETSKQNPLAVKTELETNLFQAAYSHSDTNLALPAALPCQSACFPDKRRLSLLSQVSQCVDSDSGELWRGRCSAEELNGQPQCCLGPYGCLEPKSVGPVDRESRPPCSEGGEMGGSSRKLG